MRWKGVLVVTVSVSGCAGNPAAPAVPVEPARHIALAPPHPMRDELVARFREASTDGNWKGKMLDDAPCRLLVPYKGAPIDRCHLQIAANGTAPVVTVVFDCGEHLCSTRHYVFHGNEPKPYELDPHGALVTLEVSPDHRFLLVGHLGYPEEEDAAFIPDRGITTRIDFATGETKDVAPCMSPSLSPKSLYYYCRNIRGDVLRFASDFGPTELVVRADISPDDRIKIGGPFEDFPVPVEFMPGGMLRYSLYLEKVEEIVQREAAYAE